MTNNQLVREFAKIADKVRNRLRVCLEVDDDSGEALDQGIVLAARLYEYTGAFTGFHGCALVARELGLNHGAGPS